MKKRYVFLAALAIFSPLTNAANVVYLCQSSNGETLARVQIDEATKKCQFAIAAKGFYMTDLDSDDAQVINDQNRLVVSLTKAGEKSAFAQLSVVEATTSSLDAQTEMLANHTAVLITDTMNELSRNELSCFKFVQ